MEDAPRLLLTNDDGIDAPGIRALADALSTVADVTVVAPRAEQSGTWRKRSYEFGVEERPEGYAVDGTPADCVNFGLRGLDTEFDAVVSGCNDGPNIGAHIVEHSGTVGAARQAAFLGTPAAAVSLYCHPGGDREFERAAYEPAERVAADLVPVLGSENLPFEYLNVNVPENPAAPEPRVTELAHDPDIRIHETEDGYRMDDRFYDPLREDRDASVTDAATDRGAVADGRVSVTPLLTTGVAPDRKTVARLLDGVRSE